MPSLCSSRSCNSLIALPSSSRASSSIGIAGRWNGNRQQREQVPKNAAHLRVIFDHYPADGGADMVSIFLQFGVK
ncbi:hypothetical protein [Paenibacillus algorifonticola]|nr:hypothetical protein [Paenibacillus algorifonticola]